MNYHDYKKAFWTWLICLIIFTIFGSWYCYKLIVDGSLTSIIFLGIFIVILGFNYLRINKMRKKLKEEKEKDYQELKENIVKAL